LFHPGITPFGSDKLKENKENGENKRLSMNSLKDLNDSYLGRTACRSSNTNMVLKNKYLV